MSFTTAMSVVIGMALVIFAAGLYLIHLKEKNKNSLK